MRDRFHHIELLLLFKTAKSTTSIQLQLQPTRNVMLCLVIYFFIVYCIHNLYYDIHRLYVPMSPAHNALWAGRNMSFFLVWLCTSLQSLTEPRYLHCIRDGKVSLSGKYHRRFVIIRYHTTSANL